MSLPAEAYDVPLCIQDRRFRANGTLFYDPLDHNGTLGDVWVINGKAQPFLKVQRRKYRFRVLNGCNARFLELRLSNGQPFIGLGKDTWLFPNAIERNTLLLSMGAASGRGYRLHECPQRTVYGEHSGAG